jgi:protein phosphatase
MVSEEEVAEILTGADSLERAGRQLIDAANAAGGRDNITVVLFRVEEVDAGGDADRATASLPAVAPAAQARSDPPPAANPDAIRATPLEPVPAQPRAGSDRGPRRRSGRWAKPVAALVAVVVVLFLVGGAGFLATRQLYFIGTNGQGIITIYRGLPYNLPAGIHLYETYYVSGVPAALIPSDRRSALLDNHLRSQKDAISVVRALELGKISG